MARIADKSGRLTKQYRTHGVYHPAHRKSGYHKKLLRGARSSRRPIVQTPPNPAIKIITAFIFVSIPLGVILYYAPFFTPLVVGSLLLWVIDKSIKKTFHIVERRWSMPVSWLWTIITGLEMIISFFAALLFTVGEINSTPLIVSVLIYILLSIWILACKCAKLRKRVE